MIPSRGFTLTGKGGKQNVLVGKKHSIEEKFVLFIDFYFVFEGVIGFLKNCNLYTARGVKSRR